MEPRPEGTRPDHCPIPGPYTNWRLRFPQEVCVPCVPRLGRCGPWRPGPRSSPASPSQHRYCSCILGPLLWPGAASSLWRGGGGTASGTPSQSRTCGGHSLIFWWPEPAQRPSGPGHRQGVCACTGQGCAKSPTPSRGHFFTASQRGQLRAQGIPRVGGREGQGPREQSWHVLATHVTPQRHSHRGGHPRAWLHWGGAEPGSPYSKKVPGTEGWVVGCCIGTSGWSSVSARFTEI